MIDLLPPPDVTAILLAILLAWWSLRRQIAKRFEADDVEVNFNKALDAVRMNMSDGATRGPSPQVVCDAEECTFPNCACANFAALTRRSRQFAAPDQPKPGVPDAQDRV